MKLKLLDAAGTVLFEGEQSSMLMTPVGPEQWRAVGEGAAYRVIDPVRSHLVKANAAAQSSLTAPARPAVDGEKVSSAQTLVSEAATLKIETAHAVAEAIKRGENE
jgi:hypothetical protein